MSVVLTVIIVVALIALCAIIGTWIMSRVIGVAPVMADLPAEEAQATLDGNRAFALNGEYNKVGFSTVKRGYAPAQVDDLLGALFMELQRTRGELEASKSNEAKETPANSEQFPQP